MKIWIDADACPNPIKEILYRAAARTATRLIVVANTLIITPPSQFITTVRVEKGFDSADNYIVQNLEPDDLVITADIPLAADAIAKHGLALNPRGELYTANDIKQRLSMRDMREQLRAGGVNVGGPKTFGDKEKAAFARVLDKILAKAK